MNLHRTQESWEKLSKELGYTSLEKLLHHCYVANKYTAKQLGDLLGVSRYRVCQLMRKYNIPVRGRGGVN